MVLNAVCCTFRTGPDTVVLNAAEPSKEKEKQGFFRAIKKKKKKSQMVTCTSSPSEDVSRVWMQNFSMHMSVCISPLLPFECLTRWPYRQKYEVISSVCPAHHVSLCHQSCSSLLQMQVPEGRPPVIKKCLFPLFSPKNNIKHSSSVRVLPVMSSSMVHAVLHYPTRLLTPCLPSNTACINSNNQDLCCFVWSLFYCFFFHLLTRMTKFTHKMM